MRRHWSDAVFVRLRRLMGLRTELMVLTVAEVVALSYYGGLAADGPDPVVRAVAARIVADEHPHVRFQRDRLRAGFAESRIALRLLALAFWWMTAIGAPGSPATCSPTSRRWRPRFSNGGTLFCRASHCRRFRKVFSPPSGGCDGHRGVRLSPARGADRARRRIGSEYRADAGNESCRGNQRGTRRRREVVGRNGCHPSRRQDGAAPSRTP